MSDDQNDSATTIVMCLAGITRVIREEFDGSLNGTRVILPTDAWKWMPKLIERFGLADRVKKQYGNTLMEVPGFAFSWQDRPPRQND